MLTISAPHRPKAAPEPQAHRGGVKAPPAGEQPASLEHALAFGLRMLERVHRFAAQLDLPVLGNINLPPVVGSAADQARLQTVAPLYLASELEAAQLLPAVETLAGVFLSGGIQADIGAAGRVLTDFWQTRRQRFSVQERQALFARLFGETAGPTLATLDGRNTEFESLMIDLTEALYKLEPIPGYGPQPDTEVTLQTAANQLAENLAPRSGGIAAYAGTEILNATRTALEILKQSAVQQAVGAHSVWDAVEVISRSYLNQEANVSLHVTRGKSGLTVLGWLAQVASSLGGSPEATAQPGSDVISAATAWLQSSLSLGEQQQAATTGARA